jgi:hypothetical protein
LNATGGDLLSLSLCAREVFQPGGNGGRYSVAMFVVINRSAWINVLLRRKVEKIRCVIERNGWELSWCVAETKELRNEVMCIGREERMGAAPV